MKIACCPHCGSSKVNVCRTNEDACWIECADERCGAQTASRKTRRGAIDVWNSRMPPRTAYAVVIEDDDAEFRERRKRLSAA